MSASDSTAPMPRRITIRLPRPLWIGLVAVALLLAGVGTQVGLPIYRQHAAIQEVERLGGHLTMPLHGPDWVRQMIGHRRLPLVDNVEFVRFPPSKPTFRRRFWGMISGPVPWTNGPDVDDSSLGCLSGLPRLRELDIRWTNVGDAGMKHVAPLHDLEVLLIEGTDVSDESTEPLGKLTSLKSLFLGHTRISDSGLRRLKCLKNLETIQLDPRQLTSTGIAQIREMRSIQFVRIIGNSEDVDDVVDAVKSAMPWVKFDIE